MGVEGAEGGAGNDGATSRGGTYQGTTPITVSRRFNKNCGILIHNTR